MSSTPRLSPNVEAIMARAQALALATSCGLVGTEHFLYAMLENDNLRKSSSMIQKFIDSSTAKKICESLFPENVPKPSSSKHLSSSNMNCSEKLITILSSAELMTKRAYSNADTATREFVIAGILLHSPSLSSSAIENAFGRSSSRLLKEYLECFGFPRAIVNTAVMSEAASVFRAMKDGLPKAITDKGHTAKLSQGMQDVWNTAVSSAVLRGHPWVCSEHLLFALLRSNIGLGLVEKYLEKYCGVNIGMALDLIERLPSFQPSGSLPAKVEVSPRTMRILRLAGDVAKEAKSSVVTTELWIATIVLEGTSTAAELLETAAENGEFSKPRLLAAVGVKNPESVAKKVDRGPGLKRDEMSWNAFSISCKGQSKLMPLDMKAKPPLPTEFSSFSGPTRRSNWLIPGRVLMGALPSSTDDVSKILEKGGVTTFLCLIGEFGDSEYKNHEYPALVKKMKQLSVGEVRFIHFPITDFYVANDGDVTQLVAELLKRLELGEVLYIHCLGGHGRTGTIAICLIEAFYGISAAEASAYVKKCHSKREYCGRYGCHLPEDSSQHLQIKRTSWALGREGDHCRHLFLNPDK